MNYKKLVCNESILLKIEKKIKPVRQDYYKIDAVKHEKIAPKILKKKMWQINRCHKMNETC